jgi:hypothetical protein
MYTSTDAFRSCVPQIEDFYTELNRDAHLPIAALLHLAKLQRAEHLSPEAVWRVDERQLVVVDDRALPD